MAEGVVTDFRQIEPIDMPGVVPGGASTARPVYRDVAPTDLYVDEAYQRDLTGNGRELIARIVANWDWRSFKPPTVVNVDGKLHVVDGQHTATAAAMHPAIDTIPVQIVDAPEAADRAMAFVRVNRDRVAVTKPELFHAMVEAGDEDAETVFQVCERAGVRILRAKPALWEIGDTMAVSTIQALVNRRFAVGARRVLEILVKAEQSPVERGLMLAVESLLFDDDTKDRFEPDDLAELIRDRGGRLADEGRVFALGQRVPVWKGVATLLFRNVKKKRGAA
jgi:hypothetical protein